MARMVGLKDRFDVAFASDTDADRHGIVSHSQGLLEPNHYLSVAMVISFREPTTVVEDGRCRQNRLFRKWSAGVGGVMLADGVVSVS